MYPKLKVCYLPSFKKIYLYILGPSNHLSNLVTISNIAQAQPTHIINKYKFFSFDNGTAQRVSVPVNGDEYNEGPAAPKTETLDLSFQSNLKYCIL